MSTTPEFRKRDPKSPDFWDERFERGFTPWDKGSVPLALQAFVAASERPLRALIPGCGTAHELAFLLDAGWDATAIDFSPAAVAAAKAALAAQADARAGAQTGGERTEGADAENAGTPHQAGAASASRPLAYADRIVLANFFAYTPTEPPDLIYERAFLCAMPRELWPRVTARWAALLPPGGLLAGYFYFDDSVKGPPFATSPGQLDALLTPDFVCIADAPVADSIPVFAGKERWKIWQRR